MTSQFVVGFIAGFVVAKLSKRTCLAIIVLISAAAWFGIFEVVHAIVF